MSEDAFTKEMEAAGYAVSTWSNGPGDRYGAHSHAYKKVLCCLEGSIVFHTADADTSLTPGDRMVIEPGVEHSATVGPTGWPHVVPVMYTMNDDGSLDFDVDGVKLRNLAAETRAAMVVDTMGPKRGIAMQGRVELIAPERARLNPTHKFTWGI